MKTEKSCGIPELSAKQKVMILIALALVFFFNNGDTALLSSAAPTILADLGQAELYALIFSAKLLTNAVFILLSGKLSDRFGRRNIMLIGLVFIFIGYLGGGFSKSMAMLIAMRAVTGVGSGLSFGLGYTILGDLFTGKSYGAGYMVQMASSAVALIGGPILGGVLATYLPWSFCFWTLVPMTVLAIIFLMAFCPNYKIDAKDSKLDRAGIVLFALAMSILLFALSVVGGFFQWTSPLVLGSLLIAAVLLIIFFVHESKTERNIAIFPVSLFKNRAISISCVGQLCMTLNSLCLLTYILYYVQNGMGKSAAVSGNVLSTIYIVSTLVGLFITRRMGKGNRYGFWARFTVLGESAALLLVVALLKPEMSVQALIVLMIVYGIFASVESTAFIMTAQSSLSPLRMAVGTSCLTFIQATASLLGTALGGTIINNSGDFIKGMTNVFLFAAIITIVGAVIVCVGMPNKDYIARQRELAVKEDEKTA
ncbi:MAG: MFS transporter [Eubacterium sp.]|nr:MFS transporter [Eubacterium sp.]